MLRLQMKLSFVEVALIIAIKFSGGTFVLLKCSVIWTNTNFMQLLFELR